jgi:hypothetical protein
MALNDGAGSGWVISDLSLTGKIAELKEIGYLFLWGDGNGTRHGRTSGDGLRTAH